MLRAFLANDQMPHNWWRGEDDRAFRFLAFMLGWIIVGFIGLFLSSIVALYAYLCWVQPWGLVIAGGLAALARVGWQATKL